MPKYPTRPIYKTLTILLILVMPFRIKSKTQDKNKDKVQEPEEYIVILLNDHYTTMEFVVEILMDIFHKQNKEAMEIMLSVHKKGKGVVGKYSWDVAATKVMQVHSAARDAEFPLRCIMEKA